MLPRPRHQADTPSSVKGDMHGGAGSVHRQSLVTDPAEWSVPCAHREVMSFSFSCSANCCIEAQCHSQGALVRLFSVTPGGEAGGRCRD